MADTTFQETAAPPREGFAAQEARTLINLLRNLTNDSVTLAQQEIALAKTEMAEKAKIYGRNAASLAAGGAVAYAGFLALVAAAIAGLTTALNAAMAWYHALWLSALIVGVVVAAVGYAIIHKAVETMKETGVKPDQTVQTLRENKQWLQDKIHRT